MQSDASIPGSVRPPRNSSDAPPPVEMCVMRSVTPAFAAAAIESPPPMIVVPLTVGHRLGHLDGAGRERVDFEDAHRPVPDDGLRASDDRAVPRTVVGPDVQPHPIANGRIPHAKRLRGAPGLGLAATT